MPIRQASGLLVAALIAVTGRGVGAQGQRGQPTPPTGTGFLAGQVIDVASGRPVPQATVLLISRPGPTTGRLVLTTPPVVADSQGRFFFADLPGGTYSFQVTKPGYSAVSVASMSRTTELAVGARIADVKIRLSRLASLAGTVRDDAGDPVVGTDVVALRYSIQNGRPVLSRFGVARDRTDDRGMYRVAGLPAGEYLICACGRDPIPFDGLLLTTLASEPLQLLGVAGRALTVGAGVVSLDSTLRTFAPTFYPASSTVARATRVTLSSGDEKTGIDITVDPVHATRVSGTVTGAPSPVLASSMRLVPAGEREEAVAFAALTPMLVQPDGRFDFSGVPPGQYVLHVLHTVFSRGNGAPSGAALAFLGSRAGGPGTPGGELASVGNQVDEPPLWAAEPVTVGDDGVTGLSITLRRSTKIAGRVEFVGSGPPPTAPVLTRMAVFALPVDPDPSRPGGGGIGRVSAEGTFEVRGVVPGRYRINANGVPGWPTLKSIVVAGRDTTDLPVDVDTTDITDVVVTFTSAPMATLSGTMAGGPPASDDLSVLVFPADRRYWTDPAAASRRFQNNPIGRNGIFSITGGFPAGEYLVAVATDQMASDWQEASRLETLSKIAVHVTLADGDKKTVEVKR